MTGGDDFDALFCRHHDAVLRYALRRVDPDRAADVVSEVFLVAWRRRAGEPVHQLPWLLAVARRVIANTRRSQQRADALRLRIASSGVPEVADVAADVGVRDTWRRALSRLSDSDQEVLALVAWDQLPASQAAAVLGCSTATFLSRLSRARRRLRVHLGEENPVPDNRKEPDPCPVPVTPRS